MFTSIYNRPRVFNSILYEICKKSTDEYIRRITKKYKEDKNKLNINSKCVSCIVLNSDKNNDPPNSIFHYVSIFSVISVTYFCYTFLKSIK